MPGAHFLHEDSPEEVRTGHCAVRGEGSRRAGRVTRLGSAPSLKHAAGRLSDPSEICTPDFKHEFRRSAICPVSATVGIDWSIFEICGESGVIGSVGKDRHDGADKYELVGQEYSGRLLGEGNGIAIRKTDADFAGESKRRN